jgi:hypothetical protein
LGRDLRLPAQAEDDPLSEISRQGRQAFEWALADEELGMEDM